MWRCGGGGGELTGGCPEALSPAATLCGKRKKKKGKYTPSWAACKDGYVSYIHVKVWKMYRSENLLRILTEGDYGFMNTVNYRSRNYATKNGCYIHFFFIFRLFPSHYINLFLIQYHFFICIGCRMSYVATVVRCVSLIGK